MKTQWVGVELLTPLWIRQWSELLAQLVSMQRWT